METIGSTVMYLRSKNAGPFWLTVDAFCKSREDAEKVYQAFYREKAHIADEFNVTPEEIKLYFLPEIQVTKMSFPRRPIQGNRAERDMHGGQQYVTLLDIVI